MVHAVVITYRLHVVLGFRYVNMVDFNNCPGTWKLPVFITKCYLVESFLMKLGFAL